MKDIIRLSALKWFVLGALLPVVSLASVNNDSADAGLTAKEINWLTYMREEEKLARDAYLYLYDVWGAGIFYNISNSEQRHMDAIKSRLDRYGVRDPAQGKDPGEFTNAYLQGLYDELVAQGGVSLVDALNVGVIIEETDIDDLETAIASTRHRDVRNVYNNLLDASGNHLQAFESNLAMQVN